MQINWLIVIALVLAIAIFAPRAGTPPPYRSRPCTGRQWKRAFPNASSEDIRKFLLCFVDAMAFSSREKLKFRPEDRTLAVYRSIYRGKTPIADAMECENFLENIEQAFGCKVEDTLTVWREEVTLGELFAFVAARQTAAGDGEARGHVSSALTF